MLHNCILNFENVFEECCNALYAAYMEIGTTNVSAIFGPYRQGLVTATQKFGIPYVVVDSGRMTSSATGSSNYETVLPPVRPYNLISVVPHPADIYSLVFDVLRLLHWPSVAVFYETGSDGKQCCLLVSCNSTCHRFAVNMSTQLFKLVVGFVDAHSNGFFYL